jgi:hypothetical protein
MDVFYATDLIDTSIYAPRVAMILMCAVRGEHFEVHVI